VPFQKPCRRRKKADPAFRCLHCRQQESLSWHNPAGQKAEETVLFGSNLKKKKKALYKTG
jgi:hypothetical protein